MKFYILIMQKGYEVGCCYEGDIPINAIEITKEDYNKYYKLRKLGYNLVLKKKIDSNKGLFGYIEVEEDYDKDIEKLNNTTENLQKQILTLQSLYMEALYKEDDNKKTI